MDDGAACHRSKATIKFKIWHNIKSLPWSGNSPDLDPIENLWPILKRKAKLEWPACKPSLIKFIFKVWDESIDINLLQKFLDPMPKRNQGIIDAKVGHTKY